MIERLAAAPIPRCISSYGSPNQVRSSDAFRPANRNGDLRDGRSIRWPRRWRLRRMLQVRARTWTGARLARAQRRPGIPSTADRRRRCEPLPSHEPDEIQGPPHAEVVIRLIPNHKIGGRHRLMATTMGPPAIPLVAWGRNLICHLWTLGPSRPSTRRHARVRYAVIQSVDWSP